MLPRAPAPRLCCERFGRFWAEQAHADQPPVVIDALDRIFRAARARTRLRPGSQSRKRAARQKRPAACRPGAAALQPLLLSVSEHHRRDCPPQRDRGCIAAGGVSVTPQPPIASVTFRPRWACKRCARSQPNASSDQTAELFSDSSPRLRRTPAATGFAGHGLHTTVQHRRQRAHNRRPKRRTRQQRRPTDHTRVPLTVLRHRTARLTHWSPLSRRNASAFALRDAHPAARSGLGCAAGM